MKLVLPKVKEAQITSITFTQTGQVKRMVIESYADEIDLAGIPLTQDAEIGVNRIIKWQPDTPPL